MIDSKERNKTKNSEFTLTSQRDKRKADRTGNWEHTMIQGTRLESHLEGESVCE